jgi:dienelactone hydrolase
MTEILLFHSAAGLTEGLREFADALRAAGHTVHTPDFYDGNTFTDLEAGVAYRDTLGIPEIMARAHAAVAGLPESIVYAGFSLGAAPAQLLAQTRPGALGALLLAGSLPAAAFESPWPAGVPLSIHGAEEDPWFEVDVAEALVAEAGPEAELVLYPGAAHLFADSTQPDYDPVLAEQLTARAIEWLARR